MRLQFCESKFNLLVMAQGVGLFFIFCLLNILGPEWNANATAIRDAEYIWA